MLSNAFILIFPARLLSCAIWSTTILKYRVHVAGSTISSFGRGGVDTQKKLCDNAVFFDLAFWHTSRISVIQLGKSPFLLCIIIRAAHTNLLFCVVIHGVTLVSTARVAFHDALSNG